MVNKSMDSLNKKDLLVKSISLDIGSICCAAYSADNSLLVTGSSDGVIKVWNGSSGELLKELKGHDFGFVCVAIDREGKMIVSGAWDKT